MRRGIVSAIGLGTLLFGGSARAAMFTVTTLADSGAGSLRDAITQANATDAADEIVFGVTGKISLASALPTIGKPLTITGPGAAQLEVHRDTGTDYSVFQTQNAAVTLSGITVSGGIGLGPFGSGGGVNAEGGPLTVRDCVVKGNTANRGAAISCSGDLTLQRSSLTGNTGTGTVFLVGNGTMTDTTIADNTGAAIVFPPAARTLNMDRCTVSNNNDSKNGIGGLHVQGGTVNVHDSTFSGNSGTLGGDFWTYSDGIVLNLVNVTSVSTKSPALLFDHAATITMRNTILAGTGARCALNGHTVSKGHNIATDDTCTLTEPGDKPSTDPLLGALANNGGATMTRALLAGSPAINAGDNASVSATDQRGQARIAEGTVDIGAYESTPVVDAGSDAGPDAAIPAGPDAAVPDAAVPPYDAGTYTLPPLGGDSDDSCGCSLVGQTTPIGAGGAALFGVVALAWSRRRRRR
jgi:uncharacterized protein (TIGR03382 family)